MMDTMEDKSLCGLIKFHSARLAEVAKDTEELQASIDNEVAKAYQKGFEDGKAVNDKGCEGCKYANVAGTHEPCVRCSNSYGNQWTAKDDKIEVGDEVIERDGNKILVSNIHGELFDGLCSDGSTICDLFLEDVVKTGRHFDIASILEEMRND